MHSSHLVWRSPLGRGIMAFMQEELGPLVLTSIFNLRLIEFWTFAGAHA